MSYDYIAGHSQISLVHKSAFGARVVLVSKVSGGQAARIGVQKTMRGTRGSIVQACGRKVGTGQSCVETNVRKKTSGRGLEDLPS